MRNILTKIALTATLGLAITFTLSCGDNGIDEIFGESSSSGIAPSSSSRLSSSSQANVSSSSSGTPPSSSSPLPLSSSQAQAIVPVHGDPITDSRDGKTYETVVIGTQTWMAKNLDFEIEGSKCSGDNAVNCMINGRLYTWEAAMNACPAGWHLPSDFEWVVLEDFIGGTVKEAWKKLSATSVVLDLTAGNIIYGTDDYGFSANTSLWTGTESGTSAYYRAGGSYSDGSTNSASKSNTYYLRCLKGDKYLPPSTPSYNPVSCANVPSGGFCDDRDGTGYKSVTIDGKTWMAENLAYNAKGSLCYGEGEGSECIHVNGTDIEYLSCSASEDIQANCKKYGKLYDWSTAMAFDSTCNKANCKSWIAEKHKGICPAGWHVPSKAEWDVLVTFASGTSTAGYMLKATSGWTGSNGTDGSGIDQYGFSALPGGSGGYYGYNGISYQYYGIGSNGNWLNSTEASREKNYYRSMVGSGYYGNSTTSDSGSKGSMSSLRCVKDD